VYGHNKRTPIKKIHLKTLRSSFRLDIVFSCVLIHSLWSIPFRKSYVYLVLELAMFETVLLLACVSSRSAQRQNFSYFTHPWSHCRNWRSVFFGYSSQLAYIYTVSI